MDALNLSQKQLTRLTRGSLTEQKAAELLNRAELYRTYVDHIETARYCPSSYVLYKLITALGIKPSELLTE